MKLPCGRKISVSPKHEARTKDLLQELNQGLQQFCEKEGLNRSTAREKILETIVFEARHFTPGRLLLQLKKRYPEVGKATLYRTLPVLVRSGIIQEGPTDPEGQATYELTGDDHHDHILCLDCKRIFEFHDEGIEARQNLISKDLGFKPRRHHHVIYADCEFLKQKK